MRGEEAERDQAAADHLDQGRSHQHQWQRIGGAGLGRGKLKQLHQAVLHEEQRGDDP
jgi:hypothetical protein